MSVVRPKNQISLIGCGMMKRFRWAALSALIILFAVSLFLGAVEFAVARTYSAASRGRSPTRLAALFRTSRWLS